MRQVIPTFLTKNGRLSAEVGLLASKAGEPIKGYARKVSRIALRCPPIGDRGARKMVGSLRSRGESEGESDQVGHLGALPGAQRSEAPEASQDCDRAIRWI